jgi:hypothetical protein
MSLRAVLHIVGFLEFRRFALDAALALVWAWMPFALLGCGDDPAGPDSSPPLATGGNPVEKVYDDDQPPPVGSFGRIYYSDLTYLGAFRWPDSGDYAYCRGLMTYIPTRNSIVVVAREDRWCELDIPLPVISPDKDPDDLNVATEIMPPSLVWNSLSPFLGLADRMGGITWFEDRIWCGSFEYYNPARRDNLGITCVDDNFGDPRGAWRVGPSGIDEPIDDVFHANKTHEYIMVIPETWSARYTPGKRLAAGRHRTAGTLGGGNGPALYAFEADCFAPMGADLGGVPLMAFPFQDDMSANYLWQGYTAQDSYTAIWIESGDRQAVIIGSCKGLGPTYYGLGQNCDSDKGYHSEPYEPRLYFMDVDDLGAVAQGRMGVSDVRPYDVVSPREMWRHPDDPGSDPTCMVDWFSDFAFDDHSGRLFAVQKEAYRTEFSSRSIVHVWQVN